jgi:ubiquinone/menaquinone biosynthesis C-methylase UbiE
MPRPVRFSPGVIDYDGRMSTSYRSGRALSAKAARTWRAVTAPFVPAARRIRILDLGAGTGRFSTLFARSFDAQVIGIEPSKGMRATTARERRPNNLAYVGGAAEYIPLRDESCELAWLSHVWHHVRDRHACARELYRVLRRESHVLIRGTFGDKLDGFPTLFRFWPATRGICEQLPTTSETVLIFEANGFALIDHQRVPQETCGSLCEFAERTRVRADTALALISDSEFRYGQAALDKAAALERSPLPVIEVIDLMVFRSGAESERSTLNSPATSP